MTPAVSYEQSLLNYYNAATDNYRRCTKNLWAPGSEQNVNTDDWAILGKVLNAIV